MNWCGCTNHFQTGHSDLTSPMMCVSESAVIQTAQHAIESLQDNDLFHRHIMSYVHKERLRHSTIGTQQESTAANTTFKTELLFNGSAKDLEKTLDTVRNLPVKVSVGPHIVVGGENGGWPLPIARLLDNSLLKRISASNLANMPRKVLEGIDGEIRDPHLHLDEQVVILDKQLFTEVAKDIALSEDYDTVAQAMWDFAH